MGVSHPKLLAELESKQDDLLTLMGSNKIDEVILDNWLEEEATTSQPTVGKIWKGVQILQDTEGKWLCKSHKTGSQVDLPTSDGRKERLTGERLRIVSYDTPEEVIETEVQKTSVPRGKKTVISEESKGIDLLPENKKDIIISLCDGMGCLEIALGELGKLDLTKQRMLVSEIDEKTREVYNQVHKCKGRPDTIVRNGQMISWILMRVTSEISERTRS